MTGKLTHIFLVPAVALALAACAGPANDPGSSGSSSPMSSMRMPTKATSSTTSPAAAPSTPSSSDAASAVISITDFAFQVPATVTPGALITIKNGDSQAHTVTSKTGGFDVKVDGKGTATLSAPSKPGRYPFVCTFHAGMTSTLVVK